MNFGKVIQEIQKGKKMARKGWNGKGMFIYYVPPASYPVQTDAIKSVFPETVPYNAYIALKTAQNTVSTWVPSITDLFAEDWEVVE